jgi:type IV pilus assembly protein PilW
MMTLARQEGATLIELLISVVIGLIIAASMLGMYVTTTSSSSEILKSSKLNQELSSLMTVMVNDIRRAGYAGDFLGAVSNNKFTYYKDDTTGDEIVNVIRVIDNSCILYAYNTSRFTVDEAGPTYNDIRGFRLNNGAVEMLSMTGDGAAEVGDVVYDYCNLGTDEDGVDEDTEPDWKPLTDPATTRIETLVFNMDEKSSCLNLTFYIGNPSDCEVTSPADKCYCDSYYKKYLVDGASAANSESDAPGPDEVIFISNQIGIELSGELVSDDTTSLTIGNADQAVNVRLRNDILSEGPLPAL